jgi:hypothetical protein
MKNYHNDILKTLSETEDELNKYKVKVEVQAD